MIMQFIIFAVIGLVIYGLCRVLRCKPLVTRLDRPKTSAWCALLAVGVSVSVIFALMIRQYMFLFLFMFTTPQSTEI